MNVQAGKDTVSTESYVEQYAREHKLGKYAEQKTGIPAESAEKTESGIPSEKGIPVNKDGAEKGIPAQKEVKKDGKDTRGKGQAAQTGTTDR